MENHHAGTVHPRGGRYTNSPLPSIPMPERPRHGWKHVEPGSGWRTLDRRDRGATSAPSAFWTRNTKEWRSCRRSQREAGASRPLVPDTCAKARFPRCAGTSRAGTSRQAGRSRWRDVHDVRYRQTLLCTWSARLQPRPARYGVTDGSSEVEGQEVREDHEGNMGRSSSRSWPAEGLGQGPVARFPAKPGGRDADRHRAGDVARCGEEGRCSGLDSGVSIHRTLVDAPARLAGASSGPGSRDDRAAHRAARSFRSADSSRRPWDRLRVLPEVVGECRAGSNP